jgi:hypothetical protein
VQKINVTANIKGVINAKVKKKESTARAFAKYPNLKLPFPQLHQSKLELLLQQVKFFKFHS